VKIDFARPDREHEAIREQLEEAAARVLRSGRSILGEELQRFEKDFSLVVGSRFAVGLSSGTDALVTALHALGVGDSDGDEVIVGAFGFVAAPEAVVRVGARPVFVDVEPTALALDESEVASAVSARTRAIISVDLFGLVHDPTPLRVAAPEAHIVEDAAQAFGSTLGERQAGTLGDIGVFSFFPSKALGAAGDAGACVTNDERLAERMVRIRSHGAGKTYAWEMRGGNYRLDAMQAAILAVKLAHIPARLARRRLIGQHLVAAARRAGAVPLTGLDPGQPAFAPLALRVGSGRQADVLARLREKGIDARVHYPQTLASCPPFVRFAQGRSFPEAERATRELLSIPCHPELTDDEVAHLTKHLEAALG
jgi:dTDP-4-amino-4,6-dideoxygalactose transaminase